VNVRVAGYRDIMATRPETTMLQELQGVRNALLDLGRALLEVTTATIVTAASVTFALADETLARVRVRVRNLAA
jgi:hypothetical protein